MGPNEADLSVEIQCYPFQFTMLVGLLLFNKDKKSFLENKCFSDYFIQLSFLFCEKSERRGSNSRQPAWKAGALPTELLSHMIISYLFSKDTKPFLTTK
jgi:hypothetical protein